MKLKSLASFFTHWTKKKIAITAISTLAVAGTSLGAYKILGNNGAGGSDLPLPIPEQTAEIDPRPEGTVADYLDTKEHIVANAKVADDELKRFGSFRAVSEGTTNAKAFGIPVPQDIYADRTVCKDAVYKESVSKSKFVEVGEQRFVYKNNYMYRSANKVNSLTDVTWSDTVKKLDKNSFFERYGSDASGLTAYIINDETVVDYEYAYDETEKLYTFTYTLDNEKSTYYIKREMMTNASSDVAPVFEKIKLIIEMDDLWQVKTLTTDCAYKATSRKITADCTESIKETFSDFGKYSSVKDLPEYEIFSPYIVEDATEEGGGENTSGETEETEPTAAEALTGMFAPYLVGEKLNASAYISDGKSEPIKADVSATINLENIKSSAVAATIGNAGVTYANGKIAFYYGDFKAAITPDDDITSLFKGLTEGKFDNVNFDVERLLGGAEITFSDDACSVTMPLDLGVIKTTAVLEGKKKEGNGYALTRIAADVGGANVKLEVSEKPVAVKDTSDAPDAKDLILSLIKEESAFEISLGGEKINLTLDPLNKAINLSYGDIIATLNGGALYVKCGGVKHKTDFAPLLAALKESLSGSGLSQLSLTDIIGVLGNIKTSKIENGVSINADFDGIEFAAEFSSPDGKLKLDNVSADIKGAVKINSATDVTATPDDLDSYEQSHVGDAAADILRAAINCLREEVGFKLSAKIKGVTIDGFVRMNLSEKTAALSVPSLFGTSLNAEIDKTAAYISYGNINLKVTFDEAATLAQKLQTVLNKIYPSFGFDLPNVDLNSIICGVLSSATCEKTQNGYKVSLGLNAGKNRVNIVVKTADNAFSEVFAEVGDFSVGLSSQSVAEITSPDKENASDPTAFISKIIDKATEFSEAKAYDITLNNAQIIYGDTKINLCGNVLVVRKDGGADVKAAVQAQINGANLIKAEIIVADGKVYCKVNGYSFAFGINENADDSQLKDNVYVQKIFGFIEELKKIDFASVKYGEIVKALSIGDGVLKVCADLSAFKLGSNVNAEIGLCDNGVELKFGGLVADKLSVGAEAAIKTADNAIIEIPKDYATKLTVKLDEETNLYAELDFINNSYKFELANTPEQGEKKSLFAEYSLDKLRVKCGDAYAECDVYEMKKIISELKALAHPEAKSDGAQNGNDGGDINGILKEILSTIELNGNEISAVSPKILGLFDFGAKIKVNSDYSTFVTVTVSGFENAPVVTVGEDRAFCSYDGENAVDIAAVFNDYFGALKNLVSVGENGVKGWTFNVGESEFTFGGSSYAIGAFTANLQISPRKVRFYTNDGISVNGKITLIDILYDKGENGSDGKLYLTYNDTTVEKSELSLSISQSALSGFIKTLPQLLETVPQLADAVAGKIKLGDIVGLATLLKNAEYADGKLKLVVNVGALIGGWGDLTIYGGVNENGAVAANIACDGKAVKINVNAAVAVDETITEASNLKDYDTAKTHIDLDSFQTLLKSFIKTAERTTFRISGNVPVKLNVIGINLSVNVRIDVQVAVEKVDGKNVVYIAAEMERTWGSVEGIAFRDNSGSRGYIYYNGSTDTITTRRDSKGSKWCSKCNKFDCGKLFHGSSDNKYDSERGLPYSYDVTESALSFTDNFTDRLLSLVNFTSAINDEIKKAINSGDKKAYGIDDLIGGYEYSDENKSFGVCIRLGAIDDVMGDANIKIYHDENGELISLGGSVTLLKVTGVTCTGTFNDFNLTTLTEEQINLLKESVKNNT